MKKAFSIGLIAILLLAMVACSSSSPVDHAKVAESIKTNAEVDQSDLIQVPEGIVENYYPGLPDLSDDYTIFVNGTGGKVDEIAVINVKDGAKAADIMTLAETRITRQKAAFENYQPQEMPKLENAYVKTHGNTVILVVSGDDSANKIVESALKE